MWYYIVAGGPTMIPLVACSILALMIVIERFWVLLKMPNLSVCEAQLTEVEKILSEKGMSSALDHCLKGKGIMKYVFASLIKRYHFLVLEERNMEDMRAELYNTSEESGFQYLNRWMPMLNTIIGLSPLLGLFGTVFGMVIAFEAMASGAGGDARQVANGISQALITTVAGLLIAMPALVFYRILSSIADKVRARVELFTYTFASGLVKIRQKEKSK